MRTRARSAQTPLRHTDLTRGAASVEWWTTLQEEATPKTLTGSSVLSFDDDALFAEARDYWYERDVNLDPYTAGAILDAARVAVVPHDGDAAVATST